MLSFILKLHLFVCAFTVSHLLPSSSALGGLIWLSLEACCGTSARMAALALGIISQCNRQHMGKASLPGCLCQNETVAENRPRCFL